MLLIIHFKNLKQSLACRQSKMVDIHSAKRLEVSRQNQKKETGRSGKKKDSLIFQHSSKIYHNASEFVCTLHRHDFTIATVRFSAFIRQRCSCACNAHDALKRLPLHQQCEIQNSLQTTARDALPSVHKDTVTSWFRTHHLTCQTNPCFIPQADNKSTIKCLLCSGIAS